VKTTGIRYRIGIVIDFLNVEKVLKKEWMGINWGMEINNMRTKI